MENPNIMQDEMFTVVGKDVESYNAIMRPSLTYWQDAWIRLRKNKVATVGLSIIILYIIMAIIGPWISKFDFNTVNPDYVDQLPSAEHWFGTDILGRDLWVRTWMGARVSITIGFVVVMINQAIGMLIGGFSGYIGGKLDMFIMRLIDVLIGIPYTIVAILVMMVLGKSGMGSLIIAMAIVGWIGPARFIRGQVLQLKNQEFVLAAKVLGGSSLRIILRHLIPNIMGLIITNITMAIPGAIFTEAFLSFIGIGIQPPNASWGLMARDGAQMLRIYPWEMFLPAFFISTTTLSLNLLGDGLRDALDPKMRGKSR